MVSGFSKVENALKQGGAVALLHASDGAADGLRKLGGLARSVAAGTAVLIVYLASALSIAATREVVIGRTELRVAGFELRGSFKFLPVVGHLR